MNKSKTFIYKKFGFTFKMYTQGTNVTAQMIKIPKQKEDLFNKFIGTAILKKSDVYDYKLGRDIAVKGAINAFSSYIIARVTRKLNGVASELRHFNDTLSTKINTRRVQEN